VKKFRDLSALLDKPPAEFPDGTTRAQVEAEAVRYTRLVDDWKAAVEEIRTLDGFSRFLLPPLFSDIQVAARGGPIIVLLASRSSCDAIIVLHKHPPVSVHLATDLEKLGQLAIALQLSVRREAGPGEKQGRLIEALRELWDDVVYPVVESLRRMKVEPGSRIWWCPTLWFNFLPLHAAGEYKHRGKNLSQIFVSSYIASMTTLIKARRRHDRSLPVHFAAIGQDLPNGALGRLAFVEPELDLVQSLLPTPPTVSFTKVTSEESTRSRALVAVKDNTWLHFSCHGTQNFEEPFKSAFHMRDQPLSLLDIVQTDLSHHEFAFLSACKTAVGDFRTPDEVIHLAAGLQFAGVKSVIGTLWSVEDSTVQRLVEAFYQHLCAEGQMNPRKAAQALHKAVTSIASEKDIPFDQRIVFMHIGV